MEKYSATMGLDHEETLMLAGTHTSICRFGKDDTDFEAVWRCIRRAAVTAMRIYVTTTANGGDGPTSVITCISY